MVVTSFSDVTIFALAEMMIDLKVNDQFAQKLDKAATAVDDSDRMRKVFEKTNLWGGDQDQDIFAGFGEQSNARRGEDGQAGGGAEGGENEVHRDLIATNHTTRSH